MHPRFLACAAAASLAFGTPSLAAQRPSAAAGIDSMLARELVHRMAVDQAGRESLAVALTRRDTAFLRRLASRDSASTDWLRHLVARRGWPGNHLVGDSGAEAAFLMLQHSPDLAFQAAMLPTLWQASRAGDVPPAAVAMLDDRVATHSGRPQTYGTSFSVRDSCLTPDPIADPTRLDARRSQVGLPPMAEYAKMLGEMYRMPVSLPGTCPRR